MQDFTTSEHPVARTPKTKEPAPAPVSLKVTHDMEKIWDELIKLYPDTSKHAIGIAALRYGLLAIKKDPKILMEMEQEAIKAKWEAILQSDKK